MTSTLEAVTARARSGATAQAWRLFREGGFDGVADDAAVLCVRGRLLKDEARAAAVEGERRRLYREAGDAYARAGAIDGSTYPLINAATLAFLAGDRGEASARAEAVLAQGDDPDETPYYRAATRAEALLLVGRTGEARAALEVAIARAPRAWEDHASTLRQFRLILAEAGAPAGWADMLRPPSCLHYAGHMALADPDKVAREVEAVLDEEAPGFGFGALAAGADLVIAEALLARGAELHVVLPAGRTAFEQASVGSAWRVRFERALEQAESVWVTGGATPPDALDIELAAEAAMGAAVMKAESLLAETLQLLLLGPEDDIEAGVSGGAVRRLWAGRPQRLLRAPRGAGQGAKAEPPRAGASLAAVVRVSGAAEGLAGADIEPPFAEMRGEQAHLLVYDRPAQAAATVMDLLARFGEAVRIGADYGVVQITGAGELRGAAVTMADRVARSSTPGCAQVSAAFAAALHLGQTPPARAEYMGDLSGSDPDNPVGIYALAPARG